MRCVDREELRKMMMSEDTEDLWNDSTPTICALPKESLELSK